MDPYSDASEAALKLISSDYGMTLDEMLCAPQAVSEFDRMAAMLAPGYSPFEYRWAALALRKRSRTKRFKEVAAEQTNALGAATDSPSKIDRGMSDQPVRMPWCVRRARRRVHPVRRGNAKRTQSIGKSSQHGNLEEVHAEFGSCLGSGQ